MTERLKGVRVRRKGMKRIATVSANDGWGNQISVKIEFSAKPDPVDGLCKDEVDDITKRAARGVAQVIAALPKTDFGAENTKVKV